MVRNTGNNQNNDKRCRKGGKAPQKYGKSGQQSITSENGNHSQDNDKQPQKIQIDARQAKILQFQEEMNYIQRDQSQQRRHPNENPYGCQKRRVKASKQCFGKWSHYEHLEFIHFFTRISNKRWSLISKYLKSKRSANQCQVHFYKVYTKKGDDLSKALKKMKDELSSFKFKTIMSSDTSNASSKSSSSVESNQDQYQQYVTDLIVNQQDQVNILTGDDENTSDLIQFQTEFQEIQAQYDNDDDKSIDNIQEYNFYLEDMN